MSIIHPNIGEVFTPIEWGQFAAQTSHIYKDWLGGSTVLDPFMGEGALLLSLIDLAINDNVPLKNIPVNRLYGFDWQATHLDTFEKELKKRGLTLPWENFFVVDTFFFEQNLPIDIIFTNPPWITFNHLSQARQEKLKPLFLHYHLVNTSSIIMGGSHVDLAALSLTLAVDRWTPRQHKLVAFIPHSMLTSAAHVPWRSFQWPLHTPLRPLWYYNLSNLKVFPISCDYGLLYLTNVSTDYKPRYWKKTHISADWLEQDWPNHIFIHNPMSIPLEQRPRQGINTSGANNYFIFDHYEDHTDTNHVVVSNKIVSAILPKDLIVPLVVADNFKEKDFQTKRWLFLPYNPHTAELLNLEFIKENYPRAYSYIKSIEQPLRQRKGTMLQSYMKRGDFYALLGVGSYAFTPYKVIWQAMGSYHFKTIVVKGIVQGNQALHAYIPARNKNEALQIQRYLKSADVQAYFHSFDVAGSKSFAQPHRVKQLFRFESIPSKEKLSVAQKLDLDLHSEDHYP
ncbi:hypothetical protein PVA44_03660 [Entomospira nematocerorum]|uniref:Site-specific DNA-methyltransferase (adenine-specific) n=1 Tax=Entomospira nematocerorum TaxID=2719987 RepID=A0A968GEL7_9SPIO|nr:hypothetical protein [Entomospira nematocera]NIZ46870.1 hypothetical protein [Entomospira nematocera]WDI33331.1 hypothetical protein PVA44_03660 [Entomospira nematocera]